MNRFWQQLQIRSKILEKMKHSSKKMKCRRESFLITFEPNPGYGEDCYAVSLNSEYGMMGVFDGCGGLGSRKYEHRENHTGAYIASRLAARVLGDWFNQSDFRQLTSEKNVPLLLTQIKEALIAEFSLEKNELDQIEPLRIRGSMIKTLPTTMSMALLDYSRSETIRGLFLWSGDSRCYALTPQCGLQQITKDNLTRPLDAMENLYHDAPLSNMVNADSPFTIHAKQLDFNHPCIIITATDGIFNYFRTPMDFEYTLLESMDKSKNVQEWNELFSQCIEEVAEDDSTALVFISGYASFNELKAKFRQRYALLLNEYISKLDEADMEQTMQLWMQYRDTYEMTGGECREYTA